MLRNLKIIIIHPLTIYIVIALLECISYRRDKHMVILNEMPKVGDNFKIISESALYYYTGKGKYTYPTAECYFSQGNPSFATSYKEGGIKIIEASIAEKIPLLGNMCEDAEATAKGKKEPSVDRFFSTNYLLDNFSKVSHFMSYLLLALSILYHFRKRKINYVVVFGLCFIGGGALELVQEFFIEGRSASFEDQTLNSAGALLGILLFWMITKTPYRKHLEV